MFFKKISILIILVFSITTYSYSAERQISKHILDNGLTVILEQDNSAPVINYQMWVKVGSADEKEGEFGIAHVYEHMLFKGTEKRGVGDVAKEIEMLGGNINAYTSFDNTVYHFTVSSKHFSKGLDILSDVIQNSAFDPNELKKELEVVVEEIRRGKDNPGRIMYYELLGNSFKTHPYGRPVIGSEESVKALTREYILEFFKRWYIPNNMTLVIVGDFNSQEALKEIELSFKGFKKADNPHSPRPVEPRQDNLRIRSINSEFKQSYLTLGYHIPELKHDDVYAIDMLSDILGGGASSLLYKKLKTELKLVTSIGTYAMTPKEPGIFIIDVMANSKDTDKVIKAVNDIISHLEVYGPSKDDITKSKTSLTSGFIYNKETMQSKGSSLGYYETTAGDLSFEQKYTKGIQAVTKKDIQNMITKYLQIENLTFISMASKDEIKKPLSAKKLENTLTKSYKKSFKMHSKSLVKANKTPLKGPEIVTLDNGTRVILDKSPSPELFSFYLTTRGGLIYEDDTNNGVSSFLSTMLRKSTLNYSTTELARKIDGLAGSLSSFSGRNTSGVRGKFLSKDFDKSFELFEEILLRPVFNAEDIETVRKDKLEAIKRQKDYLPGYTFQLLYKKLYPTHPYRLNSTGTVESVNNITKESLIEHYKKTFNRNNLVFAISGDINKNEVLEKITKITDKMPPYDGNIATVQADKEPSDLINTGENIDKEQTNIGIGFMGPDIKSNDKYVLEIITEILGSHGGRLFNELREKKSLAYAVSAFSRPGIENGFIGFYIGCAPDKTDEAIEGILREINKIKTFEVTDEEINRAKTSIIGSYAISIQSASTRASMYANDELMGEGFDDYKNIEKHISAVNKNDILKIASQYFKDDNFVTSIVGPNYKEQ